MRGYMDLEYSADNERFKRSVERFLEDQWDLNAPQSKRSVRVFREKAIENGLIYRNVPKEFGGAGVASDPIRASIIRECFAEVNAPREVQGNGVSMLVPTLLQHGTHQQKMEFIPRTLTGDYRWAQGYSEPEAGSDLASLRARANLSGSEWSINGRKIWTTNADKCTHMFALVRTEKEAEKHAGISYILFELDQPGVTITPIRQINGSYEFCEVLLEDARAPIDRIVGGVGRGWEVSKSTLKHERNSVGAAATSMGIYKKLVGLARSTERNGNPVAKNSYIHRRIIELEGRVRAHLYAGYYQLTCDAEGKSPGVVGLMNKLNSTLIAQEAADIANEILGDSNLIMPIWGRSRPGIERWVNQQLLSLAAAIGGGTSNIHLNIIAERGLDLPRE